MVNSPKLSNAIYVQGHSLVKVKENIFYILFGHIFSGMVK